MKEIIKEKISSTLCVINTEMPNLALCACGEKCTQCSQYQCQRLYRLATSVPLSQPVDTVTFNSSHGAIAVNRYRSIPFFLTKGETRLIL